MEKVVDREVPMYNRSEEAIDRWFRETADRMQKETKVWSPVESLLGATLPLVHNYCGAALFLSNNGQVLPAMALLRIVGEFTIRLMWCFEPEKPEGKQERISRWYKSGLLERQKSLKKWLPLMSVSSEAERDFQQKINKLEKNIKKFKCSYAPPLYHSLKDLPDLAKDIFYPLCYTNYLRAVHPDVVGLMDELGKYKGDTLWAFGDDSKKDIFQLKGECAAIGFMILSVVYEFYNWDIDPLGEELVALKEKGQT